MKYKSTQEVQAETSKAAAAEKSGYMHKLFETKGNTESIRWNIARRPELLDNSAYWWESPKGLQWLKVYDLAFSEEFWKKYEQAVEHRKLQGAETPHYKPADFDHPAGVQNQTNGF